jgi:hypothetical protein
MIYREHYINFSQENILEISDYSIKTYNNSKGKVVFEHTNLDTYSCYIVAISNNSHDSLVQPSFLDNMPDVLHTLPYFLVYLQMLHRVASIEQ